MATDAAMQSFRSALEAERDSLRNQLAEFGPATGQDYDSNFADTSQVTAERGEAEALVGQLTEALREVEHALEKLDGDRFGLCERCQQAISPARLEARPEARLCISCAGARP
ncbi:MAG: TraR/DksA family transcriptional regulator [Acidimicrobiales bacterium]